ncbi:HYR domain-containing protein [Anaeromyxobacter dehalogenans]|nr:HYR domain-containing protein [Anaeromyxobacter dehalogenans]
MQCSCSVIVSAIAGLFFSLPTLAIDVGPEFMIPGGSLGSLGEPAANYPSRFSAALCGERYLLAWGGNDGSVRAAWVTLGGELLDTSPLKLADRGASPSIASNGSNCLVVWYAPETLGVLGVRFALDGSLLDEVPLSIAPGHLNNSPPPYDRLQGIFHLDPQVTSDGRDYLVSYRFFQAQSWGWVDTVRVSGGDGHVTEGLGRFVPIVFEPTYGRWATAWNGSRFLLVASQGGGSSEDEAWLSGAAPGALSLFGVVWFMWGSPVSVASGEGSFLVVFNGGGMRPDPPVPGGLKVVRISSADVATGMRYGSNLPGGADSIPLDSGCPWFCAPLENATAYDGRQFAAVWSSAAGDVFGAVLPLDGRLAPPVKEFLFEGSLSTLALASSGRGSSILVYTVPSTADPETNELRGRLLLTDNTAPVITVPAPIAATATTRDGAIVDFSASAQDDYAGALTTTCLPSSGSRFPPGTTRVSCMGTDVAGNVGIASFDVTVTFAWSGVLAPLSADGSAIFRSGRMLPVKFRLIAASAGITDVPARLVLESLPDAGVRPTEGSATTAARMPSDVFRYDSEARQYVVNAPVGAGTWIAHILMDDGVERSVQFSVVR